MQSPSRQEVGMVCRPWGIALSNNVILVVVSRDGNYSLQYMLKIFDGDRSNIKVSFFAENAKMSLQNIKIENIINISLFTQTTFLNLASCSSRLDKQASKQTHILQMSFDFTYIV